jgi:hypothetical protein
MEAIKVIEEILRLKIRRDKVIIKTESETDAKALCHVLNMVDTFF